MFVIFFSYFMAVAQKTCTWGFRFIFFDVFLELPAGSASDQVVDGVDQPVLGHGVAPWQLGNWTLTQFYNWTIGQYDTHTI